MRRWNVIKSDQFMEDVEKVVLFIAQDNISAADTLEQRIHQQVDSLADPNFPRRKGRISGTLELVVHPNYLVVLQQTDSTVTVLNLLHVARQYP
jgi:plasmid stabilization system protein ParE